MKVMSVVSTRPELIKMAPIIRELENKKIKHVFATTGQHYDFLLFDQIIKDLALPEPDYNLTVGSGSPGIQVGISMLVMERVLDKEKPDIVLAEGDTNSVLAAALAAHKNGFQFGHVEAGLRSFDMTMPEESNRKLTDHLSNMLFAPTELSAKNLMKESVEEKRIFVTGNTIVDAVQQQLPIANEKSKILQELGLSKDGYLLMTFHRAENTTKEKLTQLAGIIRDTGRKVLYPVHPRTAKLIEHYGLKKEFDSVENLSMIDPVGYLDFLVLMENASMMLTDSGGLQEEATVLKTPTLVLRQNTERPEALGAGCELVGMDKEKIRKLMESPPKPGKESPFGDGKTGARIVELLETQDMEALKFKPSNMMKG